MREIELDKRKIEDIKQSDFLQLFSYKKGKEEMFFGQLKDERWVWVFLGDVFHLYPDEYIEAIEEVVDDGWIRIKTK